MMYIPTISKPQGRLEVYSFGFSPTLSVYKTLDTLVVVTNDYATSNYSCMLVEVESCTVYLIITNGS
jgi:hypothetical protein